MPRWSEDYYALLGIDADADDSEVRRVWRLLAKRWHPDRAGAEATATFQQISAAYTVLSDPLARAAYDRWRGAPPRPEVRSTEPAAAPIRRRAPGVMIQRLSRSLDILFACGDARRVESNVIELLLRPDEAAEGGMITISMRVPVHCPACAIDAHRSCVMCGSTRTIEDLFAAWLAVPPEVAEGTMLTPSAMLPGMVHPVSFRIRLGRAK